MPLKKDTSKRLEEWKTGRMEPENKDGRMEQQKNRNIGIMEYWKIEKTKERQSERM
jgi:hypothetical protein